MRWLQWILSVIIVLLVPIWWLLLVPKLNGFGPDSFKQQLKQHQAYQQLSTILHQPSDQSTPSQAEVTDEALVVLRGALTTDYIETTANQAIDDTASWLTNQTDAQPELNLNDIKNRIVTAYPDAQNQINQLQSELARAQQQLQDHPMPVDGIEGFESDGSTSTIEIANLLQKAGSLDNFVAGDFRINLGHALAPLYTFYQYYQITIVVLAALLIILLAGLILSTRGWLSRVKSLGWLLVAAGVVNGIVATLFYLIVLKVGLEIAVSAIPGQAQVVGSIGQAVVKSLFSNYVTIEIIFTAAVISSGILLLIGSKLIAKRQSRLDPPPPHKAPNLTPTTPNINTSSNSS